ncbi:MAG: heat-inducible transcriptional repressor HrcA [Methylicorpusculum sp.]|uniref:heat-inducible transcriptional repressor HrcA n=1 Tax=Methylicorpusculum sp. TaxID=2713644 RepID=UPI00271D55F9|nr:heat-inducible transcriptional repressor HrcA [Methylicorpusculum sp.]MDO8845834.1 heat-inducible transcriptional repressor HrcA [Methylicorpusculum sp.]MDO8938373.1 heat-inducible transcriptional repressor HrcA [Methylicorpusculum sp.]MDO9239381.1 heat-inducible transcriptional repressor HrcA [Methylicorpusculum sp.]MDP2180895.1 heat-inducible transcriptional repressor HrcA [Methylicorpusculum sp.]MDP2201720.1 heat-inducible transcriptional repressor HrcA [Methylicorpusculum sp.]
MVEKKGQALNERSLLLLKSLIERYIHDGQPVGSRVLSKDPALNLSPATIRNVMADLEDLGLIHSPHTSAGRVPTVSGYRLFVDSLLTVKPLEISELNLIQSSLVAKHDINQSIGVASKLLSDLTRMTGVVTLPKRELVSLRHIEFLPLSNTRVLVILVTNEQEVHNKIIHTSREFSPSELQQISNYINTMYSGRSLAAVKKAVIEELKVAQERMNQAMLDVVQMAKLALDQDENSEDCVISGETNLMGFSELSDIDRLKQLFDAFSQKHNVIHLLDQCLNAEGVQIFIGEESGYQPFNHCSLVTSSYSIDDEVVGVLAVIGPTRMAYEKVIPFVELTAKLLGAALNPKTLAP